jgi:hypothetical protein
MGRGLLAPAGIRHKVLVLLSAMPISGIGRLPQP